MSTTRLLVNIDANSARLVSEMGKARKATESMKSSLESMKSSLSTIQASSIVSLANSAINAAERIYAFGKSIATALNDMERQAEILGITTDQFQKFSYVAKMADVDIQTFMTGMKLLSNNMEAAAKGTGDALATFKMLGVEVQGSDKSYRKIEDVLMDLMDAFSKYEDGAAKIAAANNLFGKSGYMLIPFLNKGRAGFADLAAEAERLGIILDPSLVKAGTKAEDVFKRLEAQFTATKLSFAPMVKDIAYGVEDILASFNKLDKWLKENKTTDWFPWMEDLNQWLKKNSIKAWKVDLGITKPDFSKSYESWSGQYKKSQMPEIGSTLSEMEKLQAWAGRQERDKWLPEWIASLPTVIPTLETIEHDLKAIGDEGERIYQNTQAITEIWREGEGYLSLDRLKEMDLELAKMAAEVSEWKQGGGFEMFGYEAGWEEAIPLRVWENKINTIQRTKEALLSYSQKYAELIGDTQALITLNKEEETQTLARLEKEGILTDELKAKIQSVGEVTRVQMTDSFKTLQSIGNTFASTLTSSMTMLMTSTDSWGEKFKRAGESILQMIAQIIAQTLVMNALFGNTKGEKITGGLFGIIGNALGIKMAEGGIITRPTMLLAGEAGPEAIIPLDESGSGNTYITNILNALDTKSAFEFLTRNPEGILTIMGKSNRTKGIASKLGR